MCLEYLLPAIGFARTVDVTLPIGRVFEFECDRDFATLVVTVSDWIGTASIRIWEITGPILKRVWNDDGVFDDEDIWL